MLERSTTNKKLLEAAWDLEEHRHLYNEAQKIAQQLSVMANIIKQANIPHGFLVNVVSSENIQDLYRKKRTSATHIMVFMISESKWVKKPYASISDSKLRLLTEKIKLEMNRRGMKVVG